MQRIPHKLKTTVRCSQSCKHLCYDRQHSNQNHTEEIQKEFLVDGIRFHTQKELISWQEKYQQIAAGLSGLALYFNNIAKEFAQQFERLKLINIFGLHKIQKQNQIRIIEDIQFIKQRAFERLQCSQIYKILKIMQGKEKNYGSSTVKKFINNVENNFIQQIRDRIDWFLPKVLQKYKQQKKHSSRTGSDSGSALEQPLPLSSKQKKYLQQPQQFQQHYDYFPESLLQQKPQKKHKPHPLPKSQPQPYQKNHQAPFQSKIKQKPKKSSLGLKKISQLYALDQKNQQRQFDIILKVERIKQSFYLKKKHCIKFVGGDQTGFSICVCEISPYLIEGNTIKITNAHIYKYKNVHKQIQTSQESQVSLITDKRYQISSIGKKYDMSKMDGVFEDKNQKRSVAIQAIKKAIAADAKQQSSSFSNSQKGCKLQNSTKLQKQDYDHYDKMYSVKTSKRQTPTKNPKNQTTLQPNQKQQKNNQAATMPAMQMNQSQSQESIPKHSKLPPKLPSKKQQSQPNNLKAESKPSTKPQSKNFSVAVPVQRIKTPKNVRMTHVNKINPSQEFIWITVEIVNISYFTKFKGQMQAMCLVGDHTGVVQSSIPCDPDNKDNQIKQGDNVLLKDFQACVQNQHILLKPMAQSKRFGVEKVTKLSNNEAVNTKNNISLKQWIQVGEDSIQIEEDDQKWKEGGVFQ